MPFVATKLDELAGLLQTFEANSRAFDPAALIKVHDELLRAYPAIASNQKECQEADRRLLEELKDLKRLGDSASTLRRETLQLHATVFWSKVGGAANCHDAFNKAVELRSEQEGDVAYALNEAIYRLVDEVERIPAKVRLEILTSIAVLVFEEPGVQNYFDDRTPYEALTNLDFPKFMVQLVRRWQRHGRTNLTSRPERIENKLLHRGYFERLAQQSPVVKSLLDEMGYRPGTTGLWNRIVRVARRIKSWVFALFHGIPPGRFRTFAYVAAGVLAILAALYCGLWIHHSNREMRDWLDRYAAGTATSGASTSTSDVR